MSEVIFGIGKFEVGGMEFGELQDCTITHGGDLKELWGGENVYPVESRISKRFVEIKAKYAKISAVSMNKILGGTLSTASGYDTLTIDKNDKLGEFQLVLKNPDDGSNVQVIFPRCKSNGALDMVLVQDDFVILEPTFRALYDKGTGKIVELRLPEHDTSAPADISISAAAGGAGEADLSWTAAPETDFAKYRIYQHTSSFTDVTTATKIMEIDNQDVIKVTVSGLVAGTYHFAITAVDVAGNEDTTTTSASVVVT